MIKDEFATIALLNSVIKEKDDEIESLKKDIKSLQELIKTMQGLIGDLQSRYYELREIVRTGDDPGC